MTDYLDKTSEDKNLLKDRKFQNLIALMEEDVVKCRAKPHIRELPHNLLTHDQDKLHERLDAINEGLKDAKAELKVVQGEEKDLTKSISDLEKENKTLEEENDKLYKRNNELWSQGKKVYEHLNRVSIQAEKDSWEIKKEYNKMKTALKNTDIEKDFTELDEKMRVLTDELYHDGYLPDVWEDPEHPTLTPPRYVEDILNPMIDEIREIGTPEAEGVANRMEDYAYRYDITKKNPNTREFADADRGLSELWPYEVDANKSKINKNTKKIEENKGKIEEYQANLKDKTKEVKDIQTKIEDYSIEKDRTTNKLD